jgi:hypothetical protein
MVSSMRGLGGLTGDVASEAELQIARKGLENWEN